MGYVPSQLHKGQMIFMVCLLKQARSREQDELMKYNDMFYGATSIVTRQDLSMTP